MRGKANNVVYFDKELRITPAYAGKRNTADRHDSAGRDHPRLCGEKFMDPSSCAIMIGSPPPMRGKGGSGVCTWKHGRITPAYAGKRATGSVGGHR